MPLKEEGGKAAAGEDQEERNYKRGCRAHKGGHGRGEAGQRKRDREAKANNARERGWLCAGETKKREENMRERESEKERKGQEKRSEGLKSWSTSVQVDIAWLGRAKAASRQFLTAGKICKCAKGRPSRRLMSSYLARPGRWDAIIIKN